MTTKYFKYAFGVSGDRASVPNSTQIDGTVSYQSGYPVGYQLDYSDPASLNIPRNQFNQSMYDVTLAIQQIQQNGFPEFITSVMNDGSPYAYSINSCVYQPADGNNYVSLTNANTDVPPSINWRLITFAAQIPAGSASDYWGVTLPAGWLWINGQTIGNASSNATARANADTADLFAVLWALPSTTIQLFTSAGAPVSRGVSAASDYASNCSIALPDTRERVTSGAGTMGGVSDPNRITVAGAGFSGAVIGASGGLETVQLTANQNGLHAHGASTDSAGSHTHTGYVWGGSGEQTTPNGQTANAQAATNYNQKPAIIDAAGTHTHTVTIDSSGLGAAHQNTQPTIICNKIIKL